jgi:hypothetical protein
MTLPEAITILKIHNEWRRGLEDAPLQSPNAIGIAIDVVVEYYETPDYKGKCDDCGWKHPDKYDCLCPENCDDIEDKWKPIKTEE